MNPVEGSVVIIVPPKAEFFGLLRSFAGSVASHLRLSVDDIDDVRLAIDEACSYLVTLDPSASSISLSFQPTEHELIVTVAIDAAVSLWPPVAAEDTLSWKVMSGLVDRVALERSAEGRPGIVIVKRTLDETVA